MPTFKGVFAMFCACEVVSERGGQLYREIYCKHRKSHDFVIHVARPSGTYVNMVKVGFQPWGNLVPANESRSLNGLKILVIDDSKTIRRTAETLLSKEGCQVFTAIDGFDALSKIADHQPDLIFVDIMMPRLDGYETCSLIKHNKVFKRTPVIMLSSKDGLFDRARGRIVGSEQYLTKPFTKDELLGAISNQIN